MMSLQSPFNSLLALALLQYNNASYILQMYIMKQKKEPIFCVHLFQYLTETGEFFHTH